MEGDRNVTVDRSRRDSQPEGRQTVPPERLARFSISEKIASVALPDLIVPIKYPKKQLLADLAVLNRIRIIGLQRELLFEIEDINKLKEVTRDTVANIDRLLAKYSASIRDWELMEKYSAEADDDYDKDPFMITTSTNIQREILEKAGLTNSKRYKSTDDEHPELPIGSRRFARLRRNQKTFQTRFIFAVFGGLSLLGPMLLMVLYKDLLTTLLTVSISVLVFAIIVSLWAEDETPSTVLGIVATYTAVLVVFVGASS